MHTFKIVVAYDGTEYHGWQIQPEHTTIVSNLHTTFESVFGERIWILGASRTDAGVHSLGQTARFRSRILLPSAKIKKAWNNALPNDIVIREMAYKNKRYDPRRHVRYKYYHYHIFYKRPMPFIARYGWFSKYVDAVDWEKFYKAMQLYKGTHDFASFCKNDQGLSTMRNIADIRVQKMPQYGAIRVIVRGQSFLRYQIRRMVGYAFDVARRDDLPVDYIQELLDNPHPRQILLKADGCGLLLRKIVYAK